MDPCLFENNIKNSDFLECDRRRSKRFGIHAPAIARIKNRDIYAFTRDVSTLGTYLNGVGEEGLPEVGDMVDLTIKVPPVLGSAKTSCITGSGRVTRIEAGPYGEHGIALEIFDFAIQQKAPSDEDIGNN